MRYISTRGSSSLSSFSECLLAGLAGDGGLYLPETWPQISFDEITSFAGKSFADVAFSIMKIFIDGSIDDSKLKSACLESYANFAHSAVAPLHQIATNQFILELFHGPTLAFKDVAMQLISRLMDDALKASKKRATIVGATSGDTGGAAIEAFRNSKNVDLFILFPEGRVSDVQRRMMTTPREENIHAISIPGNFDDCQNLVKALFNDASFREEVNLSGVNSINWARIAAQVTYYFTSAVSLGAPFRKVSFVVPTGNFGDIFAGYVAKKMGLPIDKLIIATNNNDILARTLETGVYEKMEVKATSSPSMDIQISSNFERLLFEESGRNAALVKEMMDSLQKNGSFKLPAELLSSIRSQFLAFSASEDEVADIIHELYQKTGYLVDPHTATGIVAARKASISSELPLILLSTASPAKFPESILKIADVDAPLPIHLSKLMIEQERISIVGNDISSLKAFIGEKITKFQPSKL